MKTVNINTAKLLTRLHENALHFYQIADRRRRNCEHLPKWFKDKPLAWYEGQLAQTYATIETMLEIENAYKGFSFSWPKNGAGKQTQSEEGLRHYFYATKQAQAKRGIIEAYKL